MIIKKKDIKFFCDTLSTIMGHFAFYSLDGRLIYGTSEAKPTYGDNGIHVMVEGDTAGYVSGTSDNLEGVASLMGIHLKNLNEQKMLVAHTLNKYKELSFLSEINNILSSSMDIDEILRLATKRIHDIIKVENCSIMIADTNVNKFHLKAISGRTVNEDIELKVKEGIAGRVIENGASIISNNPPEHPDFVNVGRQKISSLLCVPLKVKDKTLGILNLSNKSDDIFTSEDESLLNSMSVMIAEAIENTHLLEEKIKSEKFTAIGQMAAGIIHDIKNPMTTIKGFAGLLGDLEFTKEERKEYSKMIVGEVDRLVAMVEDLLAFSRGFKSKLMIEKKNMDRFFSEIISFLDKDMSARNIALIKSLGYKDELFIDEERFKRVIFNIAGNAREVMHDGGKFLILTRVVDGRVEMVFSDTGSGIPYDIINTVFEPFVTKGKKSGTGLGLAITKKIVEEHDGNIKAINGNYSGIEGFNGANFVISLPCMEKS